MRAGSVLGEAVRAAAAGRVASLLVVALCAATCAATLLTVGRTAAAEEQLLARLDAAGSRLLVVTDEQRVGLVTPAAIRTIAGLDTVERAVGVDTPVDVTNAEIGPGATRAPAWRVTGRVADTVRLVAGRWPRPGEALVAGAAVARLGLAHPAGAVADPAGRQYPIVGAYKARAAFDQLDAGVLIAGDHRTAADSVHVVITTVGAVRVTEALVVTTLAPADPGAVTIASPTALADLQQLLGGDLGDYGRGTLLLTLGGGAFLIAVVVLAEVLLHRRDLGRRRALGSTRPGLVTLVLARTLTAAVPGTLGGVVAGVAAAASWAQPPPAEFTAATALLTLLAAAAAAVTPAVLAAAQDPVTVLRTP